MMKYSLLSIMLALATSIQATHFSYTNGVVENGDFEVERDVRQGTNYIEVTYRFGGFSADKTTVGNQEFHTIHINGMPVMGEKGYPELPTITDLLSVASSNLKIEVINQTSKEYKTFNIAPSERFDNQSETAYSNSSDFSDVYNKDAYFPENNAELLGVQSYRSYPFASVRLCPIQYNPVAKTIKCCTEITYRVSWNKKDFLSESATAGDEKLPLNYKMMPSLLKGVVADYVPSTNTTKTEFLRSGDASVSKENADYLIVTTDKYLPAVEKFKSWKAKLGYKCQIISAEWTSANEVRDAIKKAYTDNEKPEYLLIVGDIEDVPSFMTNHKDRNDQASFGSWASDLKYACMDGDDDYTADMARGRISVSTSDEAKAVFDKIIKYEQNPVLDDDFYNTGLHSAYFQDYTTKGGHMFPGDGKEDRRFVLTSEEIRNYMIGWGKYIDRAYYAIDWSAYGYSSNYEPHYYSKSSRYSNGAKLPSDLEGYGPVWQGATANLSASINEGSSYVLYRGNGAYLGWENPSFKTSDVEALTNGDKTPVVFSINSLTGGFQTNCFSEALLRHSNGGAVGVFGATAVSYSGANDGLAIGMFDAMYPTPGITTTWANGNTYKPSDLEPVYNMGHVLNKGLLMMPQIYGNVSSEIEYTNHIFHYFGDPSMELRTEIPACLYATVKKSGTTVKVTSPVDNCRISLCSSDDAGETYIQSFDNVSEATFDGVDFNYAVTVYKHNYVPYIYDSNSLFADTADSITYIQNKTYTEDEEVKANAIEAGNAVTTDKEAGDVVVKDVNVTYLAAKSIRLTSGFSVSVYEPNTNFVASLADIKTPICNYSTEEPNSSYDPVVKNPVYDKIYGFSNVTIEDVKPADNDNHSKSNINAYVENGNIVVVLGDNTYNVIISDMLGNIIFSQTASGNVTVDMSSYNKGVYLVNVVTKNNSYTEKVVLK
jgi:hypothetical protein